MNSTNKQTPDETVNEPTKRDSDPPVPLDPADRRRRMFRELAKVRVGRGRSQTEVAAVMKTSQSSVARMETAARDVRLSTLDRYAEAMGLCVQLRFRPAEAATEPMVVVDDDTPKPKSGNTD